MEPLEKEEKVEPVQVQEEIPVKSHSMEENPIPLSRALTCEHQHDNRRVENSTGESPHSGIQRVPEVNDKWPEELWELVREAKEGSRTFEEASIEEVDLDQQMLDFELRSLYGDQGTEVTEDSRDEMLRELPPYLGPYEERSDIMVLPSQKRANKPVIDSQGLQEFLSTPVEVHIDDD